MFPAAPRLEPPAPKIDILSRYVLDGQQWMMRAATFDYGAVGREISRKGKSGSGLAAACDSMVLLDTARRLAKELKVLGADIVEVSPPYDGPGEQTAYQQFLASGLEGYTYLED